MILGVLFEDAQQTETNLCTTETEEDTDKSVQFDACSLLDYSAEPAPYGVLDGMMFGGTPHQEEIPLAVSAPQNGSISKVHHPD